MNKQSLLKITLQLELNGLATILTAEAIFNLLKTSFW